MQINLSPQIWQNVATTLLQVLSLSHLHPETRAALLEAFDAIQNELDNEAERQGIAQSINPEHLPE